MTKNKKQVKQRHSWADGTPAYHPFGGLLPVPIKCAVCGKPCNETCPGCGWPVHNGCQPKHDCKGGE